MEIIREFNEKSMIFQKIIKKGIPACGISKTTGVVPVVEWS